MLGKAFGSDHRYCDGVSRRRMLTLGATRLLGGLSLPTLLQLQAQARQLQVPARVARQDALALLETTTRTLLGEGARLHIQGNQVRLSLNAVTADALAQWLALAREKAQALPQQARLQRMAARPARPVRRSNRSADLAAGFHRGGGRKTRSF